MAVDCNDGARRIRQLRARTLFSRRSCTCPYPSAVSSFIYFSVFERASPIRNRRSFRRVYPISIILSIIGSDYAFVLCPNVNKQHTSPRARAVYIAISPLSALAGGLSSSFRRDRAIVQHATVSFTNRNSFNRRRFFVSRS